MSAMIYTAEVEITLYDVLTRCAEAQGTTEVEEEIIAYLCDHDLVVARDLQEAIAKFIEDNSKEEATP